MPFGLKTHHPDFPERLKQAMKMAKINGKELASKAGIHPSNVTYWRIGHSEPRLSVLADIADAMGVSADYLIGLTDSTDERFE